MGAPGGARRRARGPVETGAGAGELSRAPGARRLALLDVVARGGCAAHGSRPVGPRERAVCRVVLRHARARHLPAALRLRGLLSVPRAQQCRCHAFRAGAARGAGGDRMKATRVFQLTVLVLLVVSAVQVGWWMINAHAYTVEKVRAARTAYAEQTAAAQALLDAGVSAPRVQALLPQMVIADGHAALAPQVDEALRTEERHRYNQYAWEGTFFLLALGSCIAVIARALRAEARVLEEQENFLALVSHQFKTPLASLQLSLETMALRTLSAEQSRTL